MDKQSIYTIFKAVVAGLADSNPKSDVKPLPDDLVEHTELATFKIDAVLFSEIIDELEGRFGNRNLDLRNFLNPHEFQYLTLGAVVSQIERDLNTRIKNPVVVYVDDEEENLFVFRRKMAKHIKLVTFTKPFEALEYIKGNSDVALVITDEVMPGLNGNSLCDEVRKVKPVMKFILITGNPQNDTDLLHKTLRGNRFYEFLNKPLDLDKKGDEYLRLIREAMAG